MTRFYLQQKRYDEAEKLQLHELNLLNEQYGKCSEPKFGCFLNLSEIYLLENKSKEALHFAQQITEPPADDSVFDPSRSQLRLANVLLSVEKKDQALEMGRKVETFLLASPRRFRITDFEQKLSDCLHFMERAGAVEDIDALKRTQNTQNSKANGSLPPLGGL